jgi:TRAP transporter TAXI family solute receptor
MTMAKLDFNRILQIAIAAVSLSVLGGLAVALVQASRVQRLTLAAGASSGESYILGSALKTVVERHYPKIRITLAETGGTVENLKLLEEGRAQLATAQADVLPGPAARILAVLYDDTFQLLALENSKIQSFADLRGERIALAKSGGQFESFLRVAEHFGMREADFRFVGSSDEAAEEAFSSGRADAIFRVRALGNPTIQRLVQSGKVRFLPIEHAAAMKIKNSAFEPAVIPEGAYLGTPPVPPKDLPTVAVHRTLLARDTSNEASIRAITEVLMERRQEIMQEIPDQMTEVRLLLAQVRRPEPQAGLGPPLHPGAASFYDKDKPSFLLAHADYVGLILTVVLMAGSWIWELKRWMQSQQKNAADLYSNRIVALMNSAQETNSLASLEDIWRDLLAVLTEAVRDLDSDKLSEESFASCRSILQIAMDVTSARRATLASIGETLKRVEMA